MACGWENYEPSPIEFIHGEIMKEFHKFRIEKFGSGNTNIVINGNDLNNMIARSKRKVYKKYHKQNLDKVILKEDMGKELSEEEYIEKQSKDIEIALNNK